MGGAQALYGIQADLTCFSKGMGNGYPISAITGPRDLMRAFEGGQCFLSTTFGANPLSLAACKAVLEALPHEHAALVEHGTTLCDSLVTVMKNTAMPVTVRGNFGRIALDWHGTDGATAAELKTLWMQEMISRGILVSVVFLPMTVYSSSIVGQITDAVAETCAVIAEVVTGKKAIGGVLRCPVIQPTHAVR
jgi:glutamate-1-semialdehyde 2,1-aminomutase